MSKRLNVYHIVRQFTPSIGGMEDVVSNLAASQRDSGQYIPRIITLNRIFREEGLRLPPFEVINGVEVIRLPYWGSEKYPICLKVLKEIRPADIVHVHGIDFFFDFLSVTYPLHRKRLIASTHGGFFHTKFASKLKKIYFNSITRITSKIYGKIVGTSTNDGDLFSAICSKKLLTVIENGVNVEKFEGKSATTITPTIIYFGRWSQNKGLFEIIDLFSKLKTTYSETPWKLIIAGREYDISTEDLISQISDLGLTEDVVIASKPTNVQLSTYIEQSSYFICLSHHEGFGIAPIEAMSAGLIPILSDIPPFRKLIDVAQHGVLLPDRNAEHGSHEVMALHERLAADFRLAQTERNAVIFESKKYSWNFVAEHYAEEYSKLLVK